MAETEDMPTEDLNNIDDTIPQPTPRRVSRFKGPTKEEIMQAIESVDTITIDTPMTEG